MSRRRPICYSEVAVANAALIVRATGGDEGGPLGNDLDDGAGARARRRGEMKTSIRQGLLFFIALASLILSGVAGVGLWGTWRGQQTLREVLTEEVQAIQQIIVVERELSGVRVRLYGVLNEDISVLSARSYLAEAKRNISRGWNGYHEAIEEGANAEEKSLIEMIDAPLRELPAFLDRLDILLAAEDRPAIAAVLRHEWWDLQMQVMTPLARLIALEESDVAEAYAQTQKVYWQTVGGLALLLGLGLLIFLFFSRLLFDHVTRKLAAIEGALTRIAAGDLGARIGGNHSGEFGRIVRALNQTVDILREDRQQLAILQQTQASVLNSMAEGLYGTDADGRVIYANAAAERMLGWSATEMQGQPAHRLFHHTRADGTPYPVEECPMDRARVAREDCRSDDELFWRKDGRFFPVDIAGAPIVSADGSVVVFRDISERRAAEAARQRLLGELRLNNERLSAAQEQLTRQEEEQRALLENLRDGVITIDAGGSIRAFNPAVCAIFDQPPEALQDQDLTRLIPPELRERHLRGLARHVATGESRFIGRTMEVEGLRRDGSRVPLDLSLAAYNVRGERFYSGILHDISARKQTEAELRANFERLTEINRKLEDAQNQLLQSEKMASIGQLAAGVAHEINNPVGFVNSNLGSLKSEVGDLLRVIDAYAAADPILAGYPAVMSRIAEARATADLDYVRADVGALIDESLDGMERVRKIVQDLKDFSRVDTTEWQFANLEDGLDSTLNMVANEIKYKAQVRKEYAGLPMVECIAAQINQIFMNLLVNAAHAIEGQGTITLRTGCAGAEVWVEVEDTGRGIREMDLGRIFEPFFTTKPVGKGTGLGLSLAYSIAQRHGGRLEVSSEVGVGTRFRLLLPATRERAETADSGETGSSEAV